MDEPWRTYLSPATLVLDATLAGDGAALAATLSAAALGGDDRNAVVHLAAGGGGEAAAKQALRRLVSARMLVWGRGCAARFFGDRRTRAQANLAKRVSNPPRATTLPPLSYRASLWRH